MSLLAGIALLTVALIIVAVTRINWKKLYHNNKHPKTVIELPLRADAPHLQCHNIDVRAFFVNPLSLKHITNKFHGTDDEKALQCLKWVMDHVKYETDVTLYKHEEFWAYPCETLESGCGDCDDGSILLANLLEACGIKSWKIRLTAGTVQNGQGHVYVTYFCEKTDTWVSLDWCYFPTTRPIDHRADYKISPIYRDVWFSWNRNFTFMG